MLSIAAFHLYEQHEVIAESVEILQTPYSALAAADVAAGTLMGSPLSQSISKKRATNGLFVGDCNMGGGNNATVYLNQQFIPSIDPKSLANKQPWTIPVGIIQDIKEPDDANMKFRYQRVAVRGFNVTIPYLTNPEATESGTVLSWHMSDASEIDCADKCAPVIAAA